MIETDIVARGHCVAIVVTDSETNKTASAVVGGLSKSEVKDRKQEFVEAHNLKGKVSERGSNG